MTHPDQETGQIRLARTYLDWGPAILVIGLFVLAIVWTVTLTEPVPDVVASITRTAAAVILLSGVLLTAQRTTAKAHTRQHQELGRQLASIAVQVGRNGYLSNQLLAARTIDLVEMQERMEGVARDLTVNAIADLEKASDSRHQALSKHVIELGAKVDRMIGTQGGGKVVPMPNPQIYQLGIAEGERRARGDGDKPR